MPKCHVDEHLNILLWRNWSPLYDYPATFSELEKHSIGGTCSQLLWHARHLIQMGHRVQVLGATKMDVVEEQVEFIGSSDRLDQERLVVSGRIRYPDVIFLEGAFTAAKSFKSVFSKARVVHIGQNIDRYGSRKAFDAEGAIDIYAFVSPGHLANYCVWHPRLRHKFVLIRNVVPWHWIYQRVKPSLVEDHIAWVGAWTKKGLRQWAETMQQVLTEYPSYRWTLYGPSHGAHADGIGQHIFARLRFPEGRISVKSLPLFRLAQEISSARIVLVSLGNETGAISALDAHAMGRPVLSGNDMVYKYSNPEGAGIRVTSGRERYETIVKLIRDPELCERLGVLGKELVLTDYTEANQLNDLARVLAYVEVMDDLREMTAYTPATLMTEYLDNFVDKIRRKVLAIGTT